MSIINLEIPNALESTLEFISIGPHSAKFEAHLAASNYAHLYATGEITKDESTTFYKLNWFRSNLRLSPTITSWSWNSQALVQLSDFLRALRAVEFPAQPDRLREIEQLAIGLLRVEPSNDAATSILDAVKALREENALVEVDSTPLASEPSQ